MQTCLICDDHILMRGAVATTLAMRWPDMAVREGGSFTEAWALAAAQPDLCLMDLMMPGAGPVEGIAGVIAAAPQARIIVITGSHDDALLLDLLGLGVHGFLQKTATAEVILAAIELVLAGGRYLPPRVAELALARPAGEARPPVTDRQRAVLRLIAQGQSNKEIARALNVSPATVKTHVAHSLAAIGAGNRTEAALRARELGLI